MAAPSPNPFHEHYVATSRRRQRALDPTDPQPVSVRFSPTLEADLEKSKKSGYVCLGFADTVSKAGEKGLSKTLEEQAVRVGAQLVLFCVWPTKLRSVRRDEYGEIDLDAVLGDPPASFSSKGYAVTRAFFLAPNRRAAEQSDA